jgi:hypothetical protein
MTLYVSAYANARHGWLPASASAETQDPDFGRATPSLRARESGAGRASHEGAARAAASLGSASAACARPWRRRGAPRGPCRSFARPSRGR